MTDQQTSPAGRPRPGTKGAVESRLRRVLDHVEDVLAWAHATAKVSTDKEAEIYREATYRLESVLYGELSLRRVERAREVAA